MSSVRNTPMKSSNNHTDSHTLPTSLAAEENVEIQKEMEDTDAEVLLVDVSEVNRTEL